MWGLQFSPGSFWRIAGGIVANDPTTLPGPITEWAWLTTSADNIPDFEGNLPSGYGDSRDAIATDDWVITLRDLDGSNEVEYVRRDLSGADIITDVLTETGVSPVANGSYLARSRIERGTDYGPWTDDLTITISVSASDGWDVNFWWR